jgi:subtilisin family serine protease
MDVDAARRILSEDMPSGEFTPNYTYRMIYTAQSEQTERTERKDSNADATKTTTRAGCAGDRCFGPALIHWKHTLDSCAKDVRIGIIDTSFDISHPAFANLKLNSGQFLGQGTPSEHDWHGTAILSLLGGDPKSGTPGLIPDANFYLATAFSSDEHGDASTTTVNLLSALNWLEQQRVQYVNMSFSGPRDVLVERAIVGMRQRGIIFIAAAGNQGPTAPPSYPAAYSQVIAVTAVNKKMDNYRHANRGNYVDLAAPGVDIWTALPDGKEGYRTGTSFAVPFVTAIIAARGELQASTLPKQELLNRLHLQDLGPPGRDPIYGQGLALAPELCSGSPSAVAEHKARALPAHMSVGATEKAASWEPTP